MRGMAYKCVHCSKVYSDGSKEILTGCAECKSKFFFYINEKKLKEIEENKDSVPELSVDEKEQIEEDVRDIAGLKDDEERPIFLDFESIKILKPGKYLLDVSKLFSSDAPKVYEIEDGKYVIDLVSPKVKKI